MPDAIAYLRSLGIPIPATGDAGGTLFVRFTSLSTPADGFVTVRTTTPVPEGRAGLAYSGIDVLALPRPAIVPASGTLVSGTYRPTNFGSGDSFPAPAPAVTGSASLAAFEGIDPNGAWDLWIVDDTSADSGSLAGGWCLELTTTAQTWQGCNTKSIKIPETGTGASTGAPASPYPSTISVSGVMGTIDKAVVVLKKLTHRYSVDIDALLTGPSGRQAILLPDAGGTASDVTLRFDDHWVGVLLAGLRQNAADRSNVAVMNGGGEAEGDIVVRLTVVSGDPSAPAQKTLPDEVLSPGGFKQFSGILGTIGASTGWVHVEKVKGHAPLYAYGVVNDMGNSDGSFVSPVLDSDGAGVTSVTIPVVVESGMFSSELVLTNTTSSTRSISAQLVADTITTSDHRATFSITLKPGEQKVIPNIVQYLRDQKVTGVPPAGTSVAGALSASTYPDFVGVLLGVRTSAPGAKGRYGLFYSAVPTAAAFDGSSWLYGLLQDGENRTNLALVNTSTSSSATDEFKIELLDASTGRLAATISDVEVPAGGWKQIPVILSQAPGVERAYAKITRTSGYAKYFAYAVLNDGAGAGLRSGDGAFVWAQPDCAFTVPASRAFGWSGGPTSLSVTASSGCYWSTSSDTPWITITGEAWGKGSGSIDYTVATNEVASQRAGSLTAAGKTFSVSQLGNAPGPYDGSWSGTTSQSRPIGFAITKNEITTFTLGLSASIGSCSVSGTFTAESFPRPVVLSSAFSTSYLVGGSGGAASVSVSGSFASGTSASGTWNVPLIIAGSTICFGSSSNKTWTATKP